MRIKVVFVIHLIALFTILSSIHATKLRRNRKLLKKRLEHILHPCVTAPKDTVVHSLNGDIMCLRKTEEELEKQLESNGGYNRRYAAASLVEARRNFKNMFNVYGKDYENTTGWQEWRFSSVRDVSPKEYSRNNPVLKKASFFEKDEGKDGMFKKDRGEGRQRRSNDDSNITKREDNGTNIQCLPGGRKTEKGIHLCPACQRCTELPEFFFPRYVNELTCDDSKSGYSSQVGCYLSQNFQIGSCHQMKMTIDLLVHKNGKFAVVFKNETLTKFQQVYEPYTHEISTCCECMVFSSLAGS